MATTLPSKVGPDSTAWVLIVAVLLVVFAAMVVFLR